MGGEIGGFMVIGDVLSAVEGAKLIKKQADYLNSLTEKIENSSEILQAKAIAIDLVKKVEQMQNTIDMLKLQNEELAQKLATRASVKPVMIEGEYAPIMLYEATTDGISRKICPVCWEGKEKVISLKFERALMSAIATDNFSSSTVHAHYICPCCKERFLVNRNS